MRVHVISYKNIILPIVLLTLKENSLKESRCLSQSISKGAFWRRGVPNQLITDTGCQTH